MALRVCRTQAPIRFFLFAPKKIVDMLDHNMPIEHITNKIYRGNQEVESKMINSNSLGELMGDLGRTGVSETSVDAAATILGGIEELDPGDNLPKTIRDWLKNYKTSGRIKNINFIPSDHEGSCHDLLMVVCAGEREFDHNTIDAIALCINCYRTMKAVIIVSGWWSEDDFNEWRKSPIKSLHDSFGIMFWLVTPFGGRWTINPLAL